MSVPSDQVASGPPAQSGGSRAQALDNACQSEQASPSADQDVERADSACGPPPPPRYFHLGCAFEVTQYPIGKRSMGLSLAQFPNANITLVDPLNGKRLVSALPPGQNGKRDPKAIQPPASGAATPEPFLAELTEKENRLKVEQAVEGYELVGGGSGTLNALLGRTVAIHLQRSGVLVPGGTGNFRGRMLGTPEAGLLTTEILGMKIYVFVRAQIDICGATLLREIIDGKIGPVVQQKDYDRRKLREDKDCSDALGGAMPLIPGVYQVYVLLQDLAVGQPGSGGFDLVEVHCDGDCIYP